MILFKRQYINITADFGFTKCLLNHAHHLVFVAIKPILVVKLCKNTVKNCHTADKKCHRCTIFNTVKLIMTLYLMSVMISFSKIHTKDKIDIYHVAKIMPSKTVGYKLLGHQNLLDLLQLFDFINLYHYKNQ
ncbi:hypothetical protein [Moraxella lacunata]|uniref:hypothetical protein n=1 Tax=Moraxella lacunata TaxID=477 RepID=UPI003EDFA3BF